MKNERRPEVYIFITALCIVIWVLAATEAHYHQFDNSGDMRSRASAAYIVWTCFIEWPAIIGTAVAGTKAVRAWKKSK